MWLWLACTVVEVAPPSPAPAPAAPVAAPAAAAESWRDRPLDLTRHGKCRMGCRHFDLAEVKDVLANGQWIPERTRTDGRCPSHAIEGTTRDGQRARMVFAACDTKTRLVTAIDLDTDWNCTCD